MSEVVLLPATVEHLTALREDRAAFGELLGAAVPDGWPEFPESIDFTIDRLTEHPYQAGWWMHFFLADEGALLVGSGGFAGPPSGGVVELGYEIAPEFRNRGLATAAARAMIDKAVSTSNAVTTVVAHTLAQENPSTGVLRRLGFARVAELADAEDGPIWRWELPVAAPVP
ncbi:GNAT family N-acetyltransferase [Mycolicibacterium litorale]|uniref:GNAT family N-acetyltransferase n=1 Tax=Mycolicibacterium litorale TaxID=758802 RepID=UPI001E4BB6BF|nr:GNAT family protein [Mycolicibacterium litorale]